MLHKSNKVLFTTLKASYLTMLPNGIPPKGDFPRKPGRMVDNFKIKTTKIRKFQPKNFFRQTK